VRPTAFVDVARPPTADRIAQLRVSGFVGWGAYLPEHGPTLSDWSADRLAALRGGILTVNATPAGLARAADTVAGLADTTVLISHVGLPGPAANGADEPTTRALLAPLLGLAGRPHVSVKLSGLYAIDPSYPHTGARTAVSAVRDAFGADRLAWASDFSPVTAEVDPADAMTPPAWLLDGASRDEVAAVLGGTLLRHLAQVDEIGGAPS
jgi:predicted TIM-barrel fold metal-dependent hydrolase